MFITFILIIVLLTVIFAICLVDKDEYICSLWCSTVGALLIAFSIILNAKSGSPTAMDVYQGKTTLEITYKDGVPVDTVVVFKNQKEK